MSQNIENDKTRYESNQELQHQIEVMRAQKDIELSGPIEQVNNYIQALSRIYEIAEEVAAMTARLEQLEQDVIKEIEK